MAINKALASEMLSLEEKDINTALIKDLFAIRMGQDKPKYQTYDKFILPKGKWYNAEEIETTAGRYLINFYVLPKKFLEKFGYQNITMDTKAIGKLEDKLGNMVLNDELTGKEYTQYLDRMEWISIGTAYFLAPTMDYNINVPIPEAIKRRDELFDEYAKDIKKGDPNIANKIEKDVLAVAEEKLKQSDNDAYDFFASGEFSFSNNYKKTSIMSGAIENPYTHKLDILKSNYIDGISKYDIPILANLTVIGGYSRGVETQSSGYETKKLGNIMQTVIVDEPGSDCHTPYFAEIVINPSQKNMFLERYILEGSGLVLLSEKNIDKYVGKKVKLRSPMFCKGEKICNKCAGELFYKLGVRNVGLLTSTFSGSLMNLSMKKFHDASVKFTHVPVEDFIKEI